MKSIKGFFKKTSVKHAARRTNPAAGQHEAQPVVSGGRMEKRRSIRIKNGRRAIVICSAFIAVVAAIAVLATLKGSGTLLAQANLAQANLAQANLAQADLLQAELTPDLTATPEPTLTATPLPSPTHTASITLAMPAYASISISKGTIATVVNDIQLRLMELGYMDEDEPDGIYGDQTTQAVTHFQQQHGLTADGVVSAETYALLFSPEAQEYTITLGAQDTDVYELQQRLVELDYMSEATGYFGSDTEAAVIKFQKMNKLNQDGKVGKQTRELLYSGDAVANAYSYGESSDEILTYQQRLKQLGYLTTDPDGTFGDDTKIAVQRFQEANGLIADGYIGSATKAALMSEDAQSNALSIGAEGEDVTRMQNRLKELNYMSKVTGYFGSDTDTAVRSFQQNNNLSVDGKVGSATMNQLMSSDAKAFTGKAADTAEVAATGSSNVDSFIAVAESKLGCKYVRAGKGPDTFDCSGFAYWCLNQVGIKQGYLTSHGWPSCTKYTKITSMDDLKRGDIIIYDGHVAICAGNGYQIDASSSNGKVVKRPYTNSSYWSRNFVCAFRVF